MFSRRCLRCTRRGKPLPVTVKVPRWITVSPCKYNKPSSARLLFSLFPAPGLAAGNFLPLLMYPSPSSPEDLVSPGQGRHVQAPNPRAKSPPHGGLTPKPSAFPRSPGGLGEELSELPPAPLSIRDGCTGRRGAPGSRILLHSTQSSWQSSPQLHQG